MTFPDVFADVFSELASQPPKKKNKTEDPEENQDRLSCFCIVNEEDEIMVITSKGVMVRQRVSQIPSQSRSATGVRVQKLNDSDHISSISLVPTRAQE